MLRCSLRIKILQMRFTERIKTFFTGCGLMITLALGFVAFAANVSRAQEDDEEEFSQVETLAQDDVQKAIDAFNAGQEAHSAGDLDKAASLYEEALRLVPEFAEAEYQLATIQSSRGEIERAEAGFRRAISYKPEWTLPMSALGDLLVSSGKYAEGRELLEKTLQIDGLCIPCYPALTEAYLRTGVSDDVLKTHLQKLTILTSKTKIPASVWAAKAAVERTRKDIGAANESVKRGLAVDPKSVAVLLELAELQLQERDFDGASATARRILILKPDSAAASVTLARSEFAAGRTDAAIKALEGSEKDPEAAELLALIKSDAAETPAELITALERSPDDAAILGRLCSLTRLTDPEQSLQYCFKASQAEPANIAHAIGYGAALIQLKRYEQAAEILERLKENSPDNYTVRANLATAFFQLGRFEDARKEYEWIIAKEPGVAAAHYFLAISFDRLEKYTDALAAYQKFLSIADKEQFEDEIGRVELRLPVLQRQIKEGKGRN